MNKFFAYFLLNILSFYMFCTKGLIKYSVCKYFLLLCVFQIFLTFSKFCWVHNKNEQKVQSSLTPSFPHSPGHTCPPPLCQHPGAELHEPFVACRGLLLHILSLNECVMYVCTLVIPCRTVSLLRKQPSAHCLQILRCFNPSNY